MKRLDQFLCLPKWWLNWAESRMLRMVGEAAQSFTGSDLMSKKTWACFCSVSFLLCSDRDFLSPVGMDTGVIRPSIQPTPTHPHTAHGNIILLPCKPCKTHSTLGTLVTVHVYVCSWTGSVDTLWTHFTFLPFIGR